MNPDGLKATSPANREDIQHKEPTAHKTLTGGGMWKGQEETDVLESVGGWDVVWSKRKAGTRAGVRFRSREGVWILF